MSQIKEYKIEVKSWMTKKSTPDFTLMKDLNNDIPMPLMIMYGVKIGETARRVKMKLHGDIKQRITKRCMHCGITITNPISQYFGMGPVCGSHNYINPFATEEDLNKAIAAYREKLVNTTWVGYIPKSAIVSIDDDPDVETKLAEMELVTCEESDKPDNKYSTYSYSPTIHARVDRPIQGTDDYSVFLTFDYNKKIVEAVKSLRVHIWDTEKKQWEIEYKEFEALKKALPNFKFDTINEDIIPAKVEISDLSLFKTTPMQHQIEGIVYGLNHSRWLLADDMGLGKSKQVIDLATIRKRSDKAFHHCLIICGVNSLKWNWLEEIEKHSNESGYILGMRTMKRSGKLTVGGNPEKIEDLDKLLNRDPEIGSNLFIITNVESLRNATIASKLSELCVQNIISMVAIDEIHRCRNLQTQQGQGMLQLQPSFKVGMTGTPLLNTPLDLFAILKWLGYQRYGFSSFKNHFCNTDAWGSVIGYKNIDQLKGQLDSIMLRRTKEEVLDLPDKVYVNEYVELSEEQKNLYNKVLVAAANSSETGTDCILAAYLRLRQISGGIGPYSFIKNNAKLDRLEQLVEEAVYSGNKVIVYSNWIEGIKPAVERLQKYNPVVITGEINELDRQPIVNKFQNDPSVKVICCTTKAAGVGITLTAANEVIFLDEPWTDGDKEQACDRAHRIGTSSTVTIHTIIGHDTYDEEVHAIVKGKKKMSDTIVNKKDLEKLKIA